MSIFKLSIITILVAALIKPAWAEDEYLEWIEHNNYTLYPTTATVSQKDPLSSIVSIDFSSDVVTVNDAIEVLLMSTGYRMPHDFARDKYMGRLLAQPLSRSFRSIGPVPVYVALDALAGDEFALVTDDLHSLVAFDLLPRYRERYILNTPYSDVPMVSNGTANKNRVWRIRQGEKFSSAIERWANLVGWTMHWDLNDTDDLLLQADYQINGSFYTAIKTALSDFALHGITATPRFAEDSQALFIKTEK